jgi:hypothetical protein
MEDEAFERAMTARFDQVRSDLLAAVDDAVARLAAETLTLPHVVWVLDHRTGEKSCLGPFGSPVDACVHAELVVRQIAGEGSQASGLDVVVVPLEAVRSRGAVAHTGPSTRRSVTGLLWRLVGGVLQRGRRRIAQEEPVQHS